MEIAEFAQIVSEIASFLGGIVAASFFCWGCGRG